VRNWPDFTRCENWKRNVDEFVKSSGKTGESIPMILVANKSDLIEKEAEKAYNSDDT
jgi:ribosome biogenesis GTPase A